MSSDDGILMGTAVQDLSKHYQDVVKAYLKFGRHRTDLHLKEVQTQLDSIVNSRLLDDNYTLDQVTQIFNDLSAMVKSNIREESQNIMHTNVELLRQIFEEADLCGLTVQVDISSIESEDAIQAIVSLEDKLYPKNQAKTKLSPLKPINGLVTAEEGLKFKNENEQLREKLSAVQKHHTQMMTEKSTIASQLRQTQDELKEWKESNEELKRKLERLSQQTSAKEEQLKELSSSMKSETTVLDDKIQGILLENNRLQNELAEEKDRMKKLERELTGKINDTTQFKNMKKILISKNDVIKELRGQLAKMEKKDDEEEEE